jgi:ribosomal protein S12 methylthiotransferase
MKRPAAAEDTLERIAAWRSMVPEMTIRSTFIVGFPGETEQDFAELLDWMRVAQLDRVGCFEYSPVEGAAANSLRQPPVPPQVKQERRERFMELAAEISAARLDKKIGSSMQVLIDRVDRDVAIGRSRGDAPEIDGVVRILGAKKLAVGEWAQVRITKTSAYDLEARLESSVSLAI